MYEYQLPYEYVKVCVCARARLIMNICVRVFDWLSLDRRNTNQTTVSWDHDVLFRPHYFDGSFSRYRLHINTSPRYWQIFPQVSIHRLTTDDTDAVNNLATALRFRLPDP